VSLRRGGSKCDEAEGVLGMMAMLQDIARYQGARL